MEQWKPIPSLEGKYEASDYGRIRRATASRGTVAGRICKQYPLPAGYLLVAVQRSGRTAVRLVHRLVAEAFIGYAAEGHEVNHKDSDKANNCLDNLEYVTRSENLKHASNATGAYRGERNSQATITEETVREIRRQHALGLGYKRLAKHFDLPWHTVRNVAARITWKHVA